MPSSSYLISHLFTIHQKFLFLITAIFNVRIFKYFEINHQKQQNYHSNKILFPFRDFNTSVDSKLISLLQFYKSSINSLIKLDLNNIKQLNLGRTSISYINLLKILNNTNVPALVNLTINRNVFPAQFYEEFTKLNFESLQYINLYGLIIGDDYVRYFQKFKLPSLKYLNLHQNEFSSYGLKRFLLKEKYPKLQKLDLNLNFVNSTLLEHLRKQKFSFTLLKLKLLTMDINGLKQMALMDFSNLQQLHFSHFTTTPDQVKNFFQKANLTKLKQLHIVNLMNAGPLLECIMNAKIPNLQVLVLPDIGDIDRKNLRDRVIAFPKLKVASLKIFSSDYILQRTIIERIHKLAPMLERFQFSIQQSGYLIQNLLNRSIKIEVYGQLDIIIKSYESIILDLQTHLITIRIEPNKTIKITNLNPSQIVLSIASFMFETGRIDDQFTRSINKRNNNYRLMDMFLQHFDYSEIVILSDTSQYYFLRWYTSNFKNCKFLNLTKIIVANATDSNMNILKSCQIPNLIQIQIDFQQLYWSEQEEKYLNDEQKTQMKKIRQLKKKNKNAISLPNYPYLKAFFPSGLNQVALKDYFKANKLQYLISLQSSGLKLSPNDIQNIFKQIPNVQRIRVLLLGENFFNKNLTFFAFQGKQLKLKILDLSQNLLNENVFQQLCNINYQFIEDISLSKIGMKDKEMRQFVGCLKQKNQVLFPKLKQIDFSQNYLETQGISTFMSLDLPLIEGVFFQGNKDSEFFNSVFRYKASRRLLIFSSIQNYFSGIDKEIDKTHTKRIQTLLLQSESMRSTDIQQLSKFQFDSLRKFMGVLQKISDCSSLQYIRNIIQKVFDLRLSFNKAQGISSACLSNKQSQYVLPLIVLLQSGTRYGQLRKFAQFLFNPGQILTTIFLKNTYISDEKVRFIGENLNLQKVQIIGLSNNDLSDSSIKYILKNEYQQLKILIIKGDEKITGSALSLMDNYRYPNLLQISFDETSIGDEGLKYLIRNQFPKLIGLTLKNTDITKEGIKILNNLKAPNLQLIDLSCNELSAADIATLDSQKFPLLRVIIVYPSLSNKEVEMLTIKFNRQFFNRDKLDDVRVEIKTDVWYEQGQNLQYVQEN